MMTFDDIKTTNIVNLTPHEVTLKHNGEEFHFPPSGTIAHAPKIYHEISDICGFVEYHAVRGLPDPIPGTAFLVPSRTLAHIRGRDDVFAADRNQHAIRDGSGRLIAVSRFLACPRTLSHMRDVFSYDFDATERTCGDAVKPYAARLFAQGGGYINRQFFGMDRFYGTEEITVSGSYDAKPGEIIEERHGGTASNPDVRWHLILDSGEKKLLGNGKTDSRLRQRVTKYLRGHLTVADLLAGPPNG